MADNTTTPSRVHFTSAGAVRRPSFPRPLTARELAEDILKSHRHLIERLTAVPPNTINPFHQADADDLQLRADHLRIVLRATAAYVGAFMRDTDASTHAMQVDRKHLDHLFDDIVGDYVGAIEQAAEKLRNERGEHAA
jgi:hypothetical protein